MRPLVKVSTIIEDVANGNIEADFSVVKESNYEIGLIIEKMKELTPVSYTHLIYPAVDPLASTSRILDPRIVGQEHFEVAHACLLYTSF